jgi:transcriptional regulator with XRE-family HTH domain
MVYPNHIRTLRRQRGLSQHALAEATGLNARMIRRIERGEIAILPGLLQRFAQVFDVPASELIPSAANPA